MLFHNKAFWAMSLFLVGVLCGSAWGDVRGWSLVSWLVCGLGAAFLLLLNKKAAAVLIFFVALGSSYVVTFTQLFPHLVTAPLGATVELTGLVRRVSHTDTGQQVDITLVDNSYELSSQKMRGKVRLFLDPFPEVVYGDVLKLHGTLKSTDGVGAGYYKKEGIGALLSFPKSLEVVARNQGSPVLAKLFSAGEYVRSTFEKVLPADSATLMTGLVIGKSSGFSKEFTEKLKVTGTTHLVALSGYNISIIITWLLAALGLVLRRKYAIWLCVAAVVLFVLMTGAEASAVRAAIMATIMILAEFLERTYSVRSAIVFTAVVMVLYNPLVLAYDIGFQLSFAALIGIVYVKPALDQLFKLDPKKESLLSWRENLMTTTAAQLAVLPILLMNFGFITPIGIITNVLLLSFIPATMILGVAVIAASFLGSTFALIVAMPARALLGYELWVINAFSNIHIGLEVAQTSFIFALAYYALLIWFVLRSQKKAKAYEDSLARAT